MSQLTFIVPEGYQGVMVKRFLRGYCGVSARLLIRLKNTPQGILVNGRHARAVDLLPGCPIPVFKRNILPSARASYRAVVPLTPPSGSRRGTAYSGRWEKAAFGRSPIGRPSPPEGDIPCCESGWRQGGRIKSACIFPASVCLLLGTICTAEAGNGYPGRLCIAGGWHLCIQ